MDIASDLLFDDAMDTPRCDGVLCFRAVRTPQWWMLRPTYEPNRLYSNLALVACGIGRFHCCLAMHAQAPPKNPLLLFFATPALPKQYPPLLFLATPPQRTSPPLVLYNPPPPNKPPPVPARTGGGTASPAPRSVTTPPPGSPKQPPHPPYRDGLPWNRNLVQRPP